MLPFSRRYEVLERALPDPSFGLRTLGSTPLFHADRGLRHPLAAYNLSLSAVGKRLLKVSTLVLEAQSFPAYMTERSNEADQVLLEAQDHLLDSLMEHLEVARRIITCFFPSGEDPKFRKIDASYKADVRAYRDHIGRVDNYLKHSQGVLRPIAFSWPTGRCLGYFVEGENATGVVGPAIDVHPDMNSAFSFNRDLRLHVLCVYAVGARLMAALHAIHRAVPAQSSSWTQERSEWIEAVKAVTALPNVFFPDEVPMPVPGLQVRDAGLFIVWNASRPRPIPPPDSARVYSRFGGDGYSRTFKPPYFGAG